MNIDPTLTLGDLLSITFMLATCLGPRQHLRISGRYRMDADAPRIAWNTLYEESGNISSRLEFRGGDHLMVLPSEILEGVAGVANAEALTVARANPRLIQTALNLAWRDQDRIKELVNIHTGQRLFQLWLERRDFA